MHEKEYLSRAEAADYLTNEKGATTGKNTLQKYASVGGGPRYRKFGNKALYTREDLDAWVEQKISKPRSHTSEAA